MTPTLTHLALHVADLAATADFYARYCGLSRTHSRGDSESDGDGNAVSDDSGAGDEQVVWLAEPGRERRLVIVLIAGGRRREQARENYSHIGFALDSEAEVDAVAERAQAEGCLAWPSRRAPHPVGYFCGVRDPNGAVVEFSYGQPLDGW